MADTTTSSISISIYSCKNTVVRTRLKHKLMCDPHLSALEVRFHDDALYKSMFTFTFQWYLCISILKC